MDLRGERVSQVIDMAKSMDVADVGLAIKRIVSEPESEPQIGPSKAGCRHSPQISASHRWKSRSARTVSLSADGAAIISAARYPSRWIERRSRIVRIWSFIWLICSSPRDIGNGPGLINVALECPFNGCSCTYCRVALRTETFI